MFDGSKQNCQGWASRSAWYVCSDHFFVVQQSTHQRHAGGLIESLMLFDDRLGITLLFTYWDFKWFYHSRHSPWNGHFHESDEHKDGKGCIWQQLWLCCMYIYIYTIYIYIHIYIYMYLYIYHIYIYIIHTISIHIYIYYTYIYILYIYIYNMGAGYCYLSSICKCSDADDGDAMGAPVRRWCAVIPFNWRGNWIGRIFGEQDASFRCFSAIVPSVFGHCWILLDFAVFFGFWLEFWPHGGFSNICFSDHGWDQPCETLFEDEAAILRCLPSSLWSSRVTRKNWENTRVGITSRVCYPLVLTYLWTITIVTLWY